MSSPRGDSYYQKARDGIFKNCDLSPLIMETNLGVATALFDPQKIPLKTDLASGVQRLVEIKPKNANKSA